MDCNEARERIQDLLDDRLPAEERRRVEGHLASCDACEAERAEIARTMALLSALPREKAPDALASDVMARLGSRQAPRGRRMTLPLALLGAGAAAAILLLAVLSFFPSGDPDPREVTTTAQTPDEKVPEVRDAIADKAEAGAPPAPCEDGPGGDVEEQLAREFTAKKAGPEAERLALHSVLELTVRDPVALESRVHSILAVMDARVGRAKAEASRRDGLKAKTADRDGGSRRSFGNPGGAPAPPAGPRPAEPPAEADGDPAPRSLAKDTPDAVEPAAEAKDAAKSGVAAAAPLTRVLTLRPDQVKALLAVLDREKRQRLAASGGTGMGDAGGGGSQAGGGAGRGAGGGAATRAADRSLDRLRVALGDDQALLEALRKAATRTGNTVVRLRGPSPATAGRAATGR